MSWEGDELPEPTPGRPPAGLGPPGGPESRTEPTERAIAGAAAVVGAGTLASRILGFARDMVVARAFGAGAVTDAFFVAFRLPNLLRRVVAEGALSSAFIPVFTEYVTTETRAELVRMFRAVAGAMVGLLALVTLAGMLGASVLVRVMAPGFFTAGAAGGLAVQLTRLMFPYLFFVGLAALAMGMLNAHRHFVAPALSPIALNLGIIAAALLLAPRLAEPVFGLALGVLAGGAGQLAMQLPALAARGVLVRPAIALRHPAIGRIARLMAPVTVGQSASHLNTLVNTAIASFLGGGSVSYLYYADRLVEFPQGVFGIAIATAVLPTLAEQAAGRDTEALRQTLSFALRLAAFVSLPAAIGLFTLREPLVRVLYERGEFGPVEATGTAVAVGFYALGLVGWGATKIGAQVFYALGDTRTPVKVAVASMALNSLLGVVLAFPLAHGGLALASACSGTANAIGLAWLLRRRLGRRPSRAARRAWARIVVVSFVLAGVLSLSIAVWPPPAGRMSEAAWLGAMIVGSTAFYWLLHAGLGSEEARLAWGALRRRGPKHILRADGSR